MGMQGPVSVFTCTRPTPRPDERRVALACGVLVLLLVLSEAEEMVSPGNHPLETSVVEEGFLLKHGQCGLLHEELPVRRVFRGATE